MSKTVYVLETFCEYSPTDQKILKVFDTREEAENYNYDISWVEEHSNVQIICSELDLDDIVPMCDMVITIDSSTPRYSIIDTTISRVYSTSDYFTKDYDVRCVRISKDNPKHLVADVVAHAREGYEDMEHYIIDAIQEHAARRMVP